MTCKELKQDEHKKEMIAVQDAMGVLYGKWKIAILSSLCFYNERRFSDILNDVSGISNKMLSKELKELEVNKLIKRTVQNTQPISVLYQLTKHGDTLKVIVNHLTAWGKEHRKVIIGK